MTPANRQNTTPLSKKERPISPRRSRPAFALPSRKGLDYGEGWFIFAARKFGNLEASASRNVWVPEVSWGQAVDVAGPKAAQCGA